MVPRAIYASVQYTMSVVQCEMVSFYPLLFLFTDPFLMHRCREFSPCCLRLPRSDFLTSLSLFLHVIRQSSNGRKKIKTAWWPAVGVACCNIVWSPVFVPQLSPWYYACRISRCNFRSEKGSVYEHQSCWEQTQLTMVHGESVESLRRVTEASLPFRLFQPLDLRF